MIVGSRPKVIMVGPSLDSQGGIAAVANGYIAAGIKDICSFEYIETTRPGSGVSKVLAGIQAYSKFCRALPDCDIVHIHIGAGVSPARKTLFAKAAKRAGKLVILHEHRGILPELYREGGDAFARKNRELYSLADVAIVLSEEWRLFFSENVCDSSKIRVLHNSVAAPVDAPVLGEAQRVLFLGHMTDVKGPDILIRAIPEIVKLHPDCRFVFAGDGDEKPYRALALELGVQDSCEFVGWVSGVEKDSLLRSCPIYCQPSRNEGMPMALLEAMGYGRACVATRVGGIPQVVEDGVDGLLVDSLDYKGIANAINTLLDCNREASRLGASARLKVQKQFSYSVNIQELNDIYTSITKIRK